MEVYLRMMFLKFRYRLGYDSREWHLKAPHLTIPAARFLARTRTTPAERDDGASQPS